MQPEASVEYVASGANRYPSCADWDPVTQTVGFGSGRNIALWCIQNTKTRVDGLLRGHEGSVTVVKFFHLKDRSVPILLSGSADHTVRAWRTDQESLSSSKTELTLKDHKGSVNCISVLPRGDIFASGAADGIVKIWHISSTGSGIAVTLLQDIELTPKTIPLTLSLATLGSVDAVVLAVGGTRNIVQIYSSTTEGADIRFRYQGSLPGHEAWIRAVEFRQQSSADCDLLLASASQDKYIRLWRIRREGRHGRSQAQMEAGAIASEVLLSNKSHLVNGANSNYEITFEALLLGHEDWIYTIRWSTNIDTMQLLSASADNSLVIWEPDQASGIWVCKTRLGELSALKGSTTATGSAGGLWVGLWIEDCRGIAALGRTGGWRRWIYNERSDEWAQHVGVSGHTGEVRDISWAVDGSYLLSVSADQTTRAHAAWQDSSTTSWHEYARPQIHGYDLNCIGSVSKSQFVSGADEKLIRVFDAPRPFLATVRGETAVKDDTEAALADPEAFTSVPVLGLSNKAVSTNMNDIEHNETPEQELTAGPSKPGGSIAIAPPLEDQLARKTLWPEQEKLYGHGFEISSLAVSNGGHLVATACKASSLEHAVIRIYDQKTWRPLNPPLTAHSLTVTGIAFSDDDKFLLSVGRDRQWTVFEIKESDPSLYTIKDSNTKSHSRMVLGCAWAPSSFGQVFGTAGRDKLCKIWSLENDRFACKESVPTEAAATSVAFCSRSVDACIMAVGTEAGRVVLHVIDMTLNVIGKFKLESRICPTLYVTKLCWQPRRRNERDDSGSNRLAISSQDHSVTIVKVQID